MSHPSRDGTVETRDVLGRKPGDGRDRIAAGGD